MLNIRVKPFFISLVYFTLNIVLYILLTQMNTINYQNWQILAGFYAVLHVLITVICFYIVNLGMLSFSAIMVWLLYVFHFGQIIIKFLFRDYQFTADMSLAVTKNAYISAIEYSFLIIFVTAFGIILVKLFENRQPENLNVRTMTDQTIENYYIIGLRIVVLTFPIEAYTLIQRLIVSMSSGYLSIYNIGTSGILSQIGTFSVIGFIMMLIGCQNKKAKANFIFFSFTIFYIISMFSGGRMWQIIKIILVLCFYLKIMKVKINPKNGLLLFLIVYLLAGFLSAIADLRGEDVINLTTILNLFVDIYQNNPLLNIIEELGATIYTVGLTFEKIPYQIDFSNGAQYFTNFVGVLPNLSEKITKINFDSNFVNLLNVPTIGGSFVAEMYYSFAAYGTVLAFVIGLGVQLVTKKMEEGFITRHYQFPIYSTMFLYSMVSWVRGSSSVLYRNVIFGSLFIYLIFKLFVRKKDVSNNNLKAIAVKK
ncbi:MAG: hypothetical protein PWR19_1978 [Carnobacterium sp.]|uniref:O-antigen polysaccharide polymerase Wzy n=1 Tax=Carnobacterium sp. TaxID=48221 RepID=UPI0026474379|nr:O-antigen polysaccharide polymerase Wzy [Carnobacterium sp.]MDN5372932.1 hypothetical protein [Carnobacterium sp.]